MGFPAGKVRVPIVPGAVVFDLHLGSAKARPDRGMALWACRKATSHVAEGSLGAGTGATVGKLFGVERATKGGVGFQSLPIAEGVTVQALAVVNAFGDVLDPSTGSVLAGARESKDSSRFVGTARQMLAGKIRKDFGAAANTTLVVVMTNAGLTKIQATKVAQMAQDGLARALCPVHTMFDGDLVFALSVGNKKVDLNSLGTAAAEVTARAIVRAVRSAKGLGGVPACTELA